MVEHDAQYYRNCQHNLDVLYEEYIEKIKEVHNRRLDPKVEKGEYESIIKEFEKKVAGIRGDVLLEKKKSG
ncbi:MAG: hypothetical protein AB1468_06730 [Candidatus Micrarchaeota archaeon]